MCRRRLKKLGRMGRDEIHETTMACHVSTESYAKKSLRRGRIPGRHETMVTSRFVPGVHSLIMLDHGKDRVRREVVMPTTGRGVNDLKSLCHGDNDL